MKAYVIVILPMLMKLVASLMDEELQARYTSMTPSNFAEHFNKKNYTWKIKHYPDLVINFNFDNTSLDDPALRKYYNSLPVKIHNRDIVGPLPVNFDSRQKWPLCHSIGEIHDQKTCSSCWTHGVANTASDRICIHTNKAVDLSEQDLECQHELQTICTGGSPEMGFLFWKKEGLVTRQCKPYEPHALNRKGCFRSCVRPYQSYQQDKYYAREVYRLPNDDYQIRAEIFLNGPISAIMEVYEDFHLNKGYGYDKGIYIHTHGKYKDNHIVRVIGYGEENGVPYWLVANSWSKNWGENGFFKIKRFQKAINFEMIMCTGIPLHRPS